MPESLPLYPPELKRPFDQEEVLRRIAVIATLTKSSRILDIGPGAGFAAFFYARELGCEAVIADANEKHVRKMVENARADNLGDRISSQRVELGKPTFGPGEFEAIFVQGLAVPLEVVAQTFRPFLGVRGRLWMGVPLKVGRYPSRASVEFWESRLGCPVLGPKDALWVLSQAGYEPESVQTLSDVELAEMYRELERLLMAKSEDEAKPWREEIDLFRSQSAKASVAPGWVLARRKEPGEKPPPARQRG